MLFRKRCPECKSGKLIKIVYGLATEKVFEQEKKGRLKIGGCVITPGDPDLFCPRCGNAWNSKTMKKFVPGPLGGFMTPEEAAALRKRMQDFEQGS